MIVIRWIVALTWELPQTIVGFFVWLFTARNKGENRATKKGEKLFYIWNLDSGLSLGFFRFVPSWANEFYTSHEYGHSLQSYILGPLYLIVIGLPSLLWAAFICEWTHSDYYSFYPEKWANILGGNV